jgi:mRNA interferase RelE/StbE
MFDIYYAKSVGKDIKWINKNALHKIREDIEKLCNFPDIRNIKRLSAHPLAEYRLRIGEYRILFDVNWNEKKIFILKIGHRKDVY